MKTAKLVNTSYTIPVTEQDAARSQLRASLRRRLSMMDRQVSRQAQSLQRRSFFEAAALQVQLFGCFVCVFSRLSCNASSGPDPALSSAIKKV